MVDKVPLTVDKVPLTVDKVPLMVFFAIIGIRRSEIFVKHFVKPLMVLCSILEFAKTPKCPLKKIFESLSN